MDEPVRRVWRVHASRIWRIGGGGGPVWPIGFGAKRWGEGRHEFGARAEMDILGRAIAFGFLEAPLKGKLLLPTADLSDSVPLLQDVKANKPENTAGNYKCRPRKFQMRLP